jgi:hypothetical protein
MKLTVSQLNLITKEAKTKIWKQLISSITIGLLIAQSRLVLSWKKGAEKPWITRMLL